jgi:hypothetical protein
MPIRSFKVGDNILDIPDTKVDAFLAEIPDAIEVKSFTVGSDTLDIPIDKLDAFLSEVPTAKPLVLKKKDLSENRKGIGSSEQSMRPAEYMDDGAPSTTPEKTKPIQKSFGSSYASSLESLTGETPKVELGKVPEINFGYKKPAAVIARENREAVSDEVDSYMPTLEKTISDAAKEVTDLEQKYAKELREIDQALSSAQIPVAGAMGEIRKSSRPKELQAADAKLKRLWVAKDMLIAAKEYAKIDRTAEGSKSFMGRFFSSIKNSDWLNVISAGGKQLDFDAEVIEVARKAEKEGVKSLTPDEEGLLVAYSVLNNTKSLEDRSVADMAGEGLVQSIPFLVQFATSGGVGAATKAGVAKIGKQIVAKYGRNKALQLVTNAGVKIAEYTAAGTTRSLYGPTVVTAIMDRKASNVQVEATTGEDGTMKVSSVKEGEGWGESIVKGTASNALEFVFEGVGGPISKGISKVTAPVTGKITTMVNPLKQALSKTKLGGWMQSVSLDNNIVKRLKNNIGYSDLVGENMEEILTSYSQAAVTGDKPILDAVGRKDLQVILLSTAAMSGGFHVLNGTANAFSKVVKRPEIDEELAVRIDAALDNDNIEEVASEIDNIISTSTSSKAEAKSALEYAIGKVADESMKQVADIDKGLKGEQGETVKAVMVEDSAALTAAGEILDYDSATVSDMRELDKEMDSMDDGVAKELKPITDKIAVLEEQKQVLYDNPPQGAALQQVADEEIAIDAQLRDLYTQKNDKRKEILSSVEVSNKPKVEEEPTNAVQVESAEEGVLRQEGPEVGLREVGEGNQGEEVAREGEVNAEEEEVAAVKEVNPALKDVESTAKAKLSDNELQNIVGRDVFNAVLRTEDQLGVGVVDRDRMIETAKRIQQADGKEKLLPAHIFEALLYETGFPDNWTDLRSAIKKGGIEVNSEAIQRQVEVGVKLPSDILQEFKKSERYKNANAELVNAVEELLSDKKAPAVTETATVSDTATEPVTEVAPAKPTSERAMAMEVGEKGEMSISEDISKLRDKAKASTTKEAHKKVREDLLAFVKANRGRLSKVAGRSIPVIVRRIAKATPRNIESTIDFVEKLMNNQELATKVSDISDRIAKIKGSGMGAYVNVVAGLKDLSLRGRATAKKISLFVNSIKLEDIDSEELINDLDELTKGLSKKVPDISMVEPFMQKWQKTIDDALFQKLTNEPTTKENVEALTNRVNETETMLSEMVDKLNRGDAVSIEEIKKLKHRIASLNAAVTSMMERGDVMVGEAGLEAINTSLETLNKALLNDIASLSVEGLNAIKKAENEHKVMMLVQVNGKLPSAIKVASEMGDTKLAEILTDLKRVIAMSKGDADFVNRLGLSDIDIIDASIDQIMENGFVPTVLGTSYENTKRAFIEHRIYTKLAGQTNILARLSKIIGGDVSVENIRKHLETTQNSNIDDMLNLVEESSPFWTETTNEITTAINKSKAKSEQKLANLKNMASKLVMGKLGKEGKSKSFGNWWATWISSPSTIPDAARKPFIKAGIVLASQRFYNLVNSKPLVRQEAEGRYLLIKPTGEPVKDDADVPMVFTSAEQAVAYHHANKATMYGEDVMDMFYLLNFGKNKDRATEARLMSNPKDNKREIELFQEAYKELTNDQSKRVVVANDADVAKFLSGVEMEAYNAIRATYEDPELQQMIVYAGAIEGVPVVIDGNAYIPMNVKSGDKITDTSDLLDEAFKRVDDKKAIPKALGNIYGKKANVIEYIDFDAFRVTYRYVNQVATSYYVVPQVRATLQALTNLKKQTAGDMSNFLAATQKDLVLGVQNEYNKAKIYDVLGPTIGKIARALLTARSMTLMSSPIRKYIDLNTQYIASMAFDGSYKPQTDRNRAQWDQFFTFDENMGESGYEAFLDEAQRYSMESGGDKFVTKAWLEKVASDRLRAADDKNRRIFWVSKFLSEYKRQSGEDFNVEEYNNPDGIYRGQMNESEAFRQAKAIANQTISQTMRPANMFEDKKFLGKLVYGKDSWGRQGWATKWFMPMSAYAVTSAGAFAKESKNMLTGMNGGRAKAGRRLAGVIARDALYTLEFGIYSNLLALAVAGARDGFDDDDESNTKEMFDKIIEQYTLRGLTTNALGATLSLMLGGYANLGRSVAGMFVSYVPRKTIEAVKFSDPVEAKQWQKEWDAMVKIANLKQSMPMLDLRGDKINLDVLFGLAMPMVGGAIDNVYGNTADAVTNLAAVATGETEGNVEQKAIATSIIAINSALSLASVIYPGQNDLNKALKEYTKQVTVKDGSIGANQFMDAISLAESIKDSYNKKALVDKEEANSFLRDEKAGDVTYGELMLYLDDNRPNVTLVQAVYRAATDEKAPFSMQERREMLKAVEAEAQNYVESLKSYRSYEPSEKVQDYFDGQVSDYFMAKEEKKAEAFDAVMDSIYKLLEQRKNKEQEN